MTKGTKQRSLACEILGLIGVGVFFAILLFLILSWTGAASVDAYCFHNDVVMTEYEWLEADRWVWSLSALLSAVGFSVLFLVLLNDRLAYIRTITGGIHALQMGQTGVCLPLEGRNELTQLAQSINFMSATQQQLRQREQALAEEKEQFLRTLSHDIRTPLTSILAYSEYLASEDHIPAQEQKKHLQMLRRKAEQIRDLTQLLLDGDKRSPEHFDNAHLLMQQLAAEFEEGLEERFTVQTDLSACPAFAGTFDVQELRRVFDNLSSNVQKYADPARPVQLEIGVEQGELWVRQSNAVSAEADQRDSYRLGIHSIRRIAQSYGGRVELQRDGDRFAICLRLCDF